MTNLRDVLAQVRGRIASYRESKLPVEEATKFTLINPVLHALGWDVAEPNDVQVEFKRKGGTPVDYALLFLREPKLFIEAKALGENLDNHKVAIQVLSYAADAGVQ